ncbi:MAG: UDP-N-acetylmuramoyl-tripeptide-D-alanyl-D-alanine ligase [Candidatus Moranbacteria bacterium GW2011_GWE1_35_17]|nr:MAG: UDP-N-acetylmuramoyl-tripeptide-D-alanyl-D-alanine ligase [Candidatus Moranbacteria bacterium GW2011_GWE2_35_164]KKP67978.1 MAG: UDP-N-acetylmuramoyl-tripeptide-D-alanyl-D-alanine ligase [Candidatus Moranbacteria bacterium GW2011_GWE1_35_17]KKP83124.1 MAG: UDP-N-acetylmuramoyl-tripeptide-D-alanyl-D-alanine ligase [Candidatus Moranbacteria bacterium GW2011_GWF1_35_5]KKP83991.1 MAG: UDP-N-acetylmuramoyl-tripeptide-D-alanyl-D-alanine ligase [Candidatus Moranbacteria bacterium GW2011_GWF2_35
MKKIFKIILQYYLKIITKIVLWVHRPIVIAVSGSVNKSFVRDEIKRVLEVQGKTVRANPKNFNTEIGLPLAILNIQSGYNSYRRWLPVIFSAFGAIFQKNFPKYLVLELGVAQKGDMRYLLSLVKPKIAIVTEITQRYIESFSGMDKLVGEYVYLAKNMKKDGKLILNWDNEKVRSLKKYSKAQVLYFGSSSMDVDGEIKEIKKETDGIKVKLRYKNKESEIKIKRFGTHHATAAVVGQMIGDII